MTSCVLHVGDHNKVGNYNLDLISVPTYRQKVSIDTVPLFDPVGLMLRRVIESTLQGVFRWRIFTPKMIKIAKRITVPQLRQISRGEATTIIKEKW